MGRILQEWLKLYRCLDKVNNCGKRTDDWIWGRQIVEHTLCAVMGLWEQQNTEMHGEDNKVSQVQRRQLIEEIKALQLLKKEARPRDAYLFLKDPEKFYKDLSASKLIAYVQIAKKAIKLSVKRWKKRYDPGTVSILG